MVLMSWISVEKQVPKEGEKVLMYKGGSISVDYIVYICEDLGPIWASLPPQESSRVKYWMELPKGPNGMD